MEKVICLILLSVATVADIRNKTISVWIPIAGLVAGIFLFSLSDNKLALFLGAMFGLIMILCSLIFKEHFGIGDGLMITVVGILTGINCCFESVFIACLLAVVAGVICICIRKNSKNIYLPYMPFLLIGTAAVCIGEVLK